MGPLQAVNAGPNQVDKLNYWSSHDAVLKYAYRGAQLGQSAAGRVGLRTTLPRIQDVDVSATVATHGAYFQSVKLRGKG